MANILQLSPATVSKALSGNKIVNKNTLNKITDLANKMGYQPNNFASKNLMISDLSEAASIEISQSIIKMKHRPDGIFMSGDPSAAICMRNLKDEELINLKK